MGFDVSNLIHFFKRLDREIVFSVDSYVVIIYIVTEYVLSPNAPLNVC